MEISPDRLEEIKEESYLLGQRALLLGQLKDILKQLGKREDTTKEDLIAEREEAVQALRSICEDHGDNEWDENLHLADIINKHLGKHLE